MKILVTGAGAVLGQAIIKSLKHSSIDFNIVSIDPNPLAVGLYWGETHYLIPMATDSDYIKKLFEILDKEKPDALLVGTDVELLIISQYRDTIEDKFGTRVVVSNQKVIKISDDKWLTYKFLKDNGFECPASCLSGDEGELIKKVGFPLIVKPRVGARSIGVTKVNNIKELEKAILSVDNPIIQECVGSEQDEYTAGVIVFNNKAKSSIVMKRDLRDGNTFRAYAEPYSHLNKYIERVAEKLGPYGPVNFQFRFSKGKIKIFEINGRFSGTTHFRALANVKEVELCLTYLLNNKEISQAKIEPVTILRYYDEIVLHNNKIRL